MPADPVDLADHPRQVADVLERVARVDQVHRIVGERQGAVQVGDDVHAGERVAIHADEVGELGPAAPQVDPDLPARRRAVRPGVRPPSRAVVVVRDRAALFPVARAPETVGREVAAPHRLDADPAR